MSRINIGDINSATFKVGNVDCQIYLGEIKLYPTGQHDYSQDYFTMNITTGGNIKWSGSTSTNRLYYSKDNGDTWTSANTATTISVNAGDKVLWKGTPTPQSSKGIGRFSGATDVRYSVEGNAMSLLFGDNFNGQTNLEGKYYALFGLFNDNTNVTSAENFVLPATTLAEGCYNQMFFGCTSLMTAPELPATTLTNYCYQYMFSGCTSLNYIKCLATDISANGCTNNWVNGVAASGTFVKDASMADWTIGVNGIPSGWTVQDYKDYSQNYFTIVSESDDNTISILKHGSAPAITVSASTDNGQTWTEFTGGTIATLNTGSKLLLKGVNNRWAYEDSDYNSFISTSAYHVEGNIMSLLFGDNFKGQTSLSGKGYALAFLFLGNTNITSAENLVLPATTLADWCYYNMFNGCSSLTTAPELPATTLTYECYDGMFYRCTSLTTAPELSATTLASYCYNYMFYGCTSLNYIKCLATDISASYCTSSWVNGVAASGTFVKDASMTDWTVGVNGIPSGWTVEDDGRDYSLDHFTIVSEADNNTISILKNGSAPAITVSASTDDGQTWTTYSTSGTIATLNTGDKLLLKGVNNKWGAALVSNYNKITASASFHVEGNIMSLLYGDDFVDQTSISGRNYVFQCLFEGVTTLTSAKNLILPATTLAGDCYGYMFNACTSLTTAPSVLPATTLVDSCYRGMLQGCSSLTKAPELPAPTLATLCYAWLFNGCTSLNYIKCLATNKSASRCTDTWVNDVSATGTFVKDPNMSSWATGINGIPSGWSVQDAS